MCLFWASLVAQRVKNLPAMWETRVRSLGWKDFLKKGMATQSSILAWRIPWTDKPGWLQSMGHKESDMTKRLTHTHTCIHTHTHTHRVMIQNMSIITTSTLHIALFLTITTSFWSPFPPILPHPNTPDRPQIDFL